jgi:hypothetical protein
MNLDREGEMRDADAETGRYEAQAGSSAPAAPVRQQEVDAQPDDTRSNRRNHEAARRDDMASIDERAATSKTQPMGRLEHEQRKQPAVQDGSSGLMNGQRLEYFAGRWDSIQAGFVDDPRRTVEQADRLVAEVIDHLSKLFKEERTKLEQQWSGGGQANTEDLRIAMQRYRDFFRTLVGR